MEEIGGQVTWERQECDGKVEDVIFERFCLQGCLDAMAPQLFVVHHSLKTSSEGFRKPPGRSTAGHLWLEVISLPSFSRSIDGTACLASQNVAASHRTLTFGAVSASDIMKLDFPSIAELFHLA